MKSATSTLQEQLVQQPGIFMSEPKEPNFFSDDAQYRRGLDWYRGLFAGASAGDLCGEASTHYTKLPTYPRTVERMQALLPAPRLIYVMRHPVDRLVSHYIHEWTMGVVRCGIDEAVERHPEMIVYGQYTRQLQPYFDAFGRDAVLPVFFDRLTRAPQDELERICRFIGYPGAPAWQPDLKPSNTSSERIRRFPLYRLLIESAPATWVRRSLVPRSLRNRVKSRLTMQQRPSLGPTVRRELELVFDRDLAVLGEWLGIELSCSNFRAVTADATYDWVHADA